MQSKTFDIHTIEHNIQQYNRHPTDRLYPLPFQPAIKLLMLPGKKNVGWLVGWLVGW